MKCIIIDDDKMSRTSLERLCLKVPDLQVIFSYISAMEAIEHQETLHLADLIFLDVHMPDLDGFDFLKTLQEVPHIIFTTSDSTRAWEAFEVKATDYLIKPVTLPRLITAIQKIQNSLSAVTSTSAVSTEHKKEIFVNTDKRLVRIPVEDLTIIEVKGDYILMKMEDKTVHIVRSTLKNIEQRLSPAQFIKVHRSYIVNISKIIDIEDSSILVNNEIVPISRSMKNQVVEKLNLL